MMKKILSNILIFSGLCPLAQAQVVGGNSVFEFLALPPSARVTALGGHVLAVHDDDVNLALANPAALNPLMHHQASFNHHFMVSDIVSGYASYGHHLPTANLTLHGGIQYIHYGDFKLTDPTGAVLGDFEAGEYAFTVGAGRRLYERVSVGANLRYVTSQLESYTANGIGADLAAMFHDTARQVNVTLALRNIGSQLDTYTDERREPLPYEAQLGLSKRLKHLPFRLSVIYRYLNRWNIRYDDPNSAEEDPFLFDDQSSTERPRLDNFARHLVFNGEFLFGKKENFRIRFGYNHLLRKETQVGNLRSLSGFAFGFGVKVKWFRLDFGRSVQHLGAGSSHLGISTNFQWF